MKIDNMNVDLFNMIDDNYNSVNNGEDNKYSLKKGESYSMKKAKGILSIKKIKNLIAVTFVGGTILIVGKYFSSEKNETVSNDVISDNSIVQTSYDNNDVLYEDTVEVNSVRDENNDVNSDEVIIKDEADAFDNVSDFSLFDIGTGYDSEYLEIYKNFLGSDEDYYMQKYSKMYGVDYNLVVAIAMQESKLGNDLSNDSAWGIMQIEKTVRDGSDVVHNYVTGKDEVIDYGYLSVPEHNIQVGCMMLQDNINSCNGNIYLALQGYNLGVTANRSIIEYTANQKKCSTDEVKADYSNIDWISNIATCVGKNFGDPNYVSNVLRYCNTSDVRYIYDGKTYNFNLNNGEYSIDSFGKLR